MFCPARAIPYLSPKVSAVRFAIRGSLAGIMLETRLHHDAIKTHATRRLDRWVFIKGGCSRRGVQWMGVAFYNKLVYNIIQITTFCFYCTPL